MRLSRLFTNRDGEAPSSNPADGTSFAPKQKSTYEINIDAEKIVNEDLDKESILERSRVVSTAPSQMPYIGQHGKYNKRWYVDIVSLPDNSIRVLISETFGLLTAAHRMVLDLTAMDFDKLVFFLTELSKYIRVLLKAEDRILYPEVDSALKKRADYTSFPLHPKNRAKTKRAIFDLLDALLIERTKTSNLIFVTKLKGTLNELWKELQEYFVVKEHDLPRILVTARGGLRKKQRMERRLIKYFESEGEHFYYSALLTGALSKEEVRVEFRKRHFRQSEQDRYQAAVNRVQLSLLSIPTAFEKAARVYENRFSMQTFLEHYGQDKIVAQENQEIVFA